MIVFRLQYFSLCTVIKIPNDCNLYKKICISCVFHRFYTQHFFKRILQWRKASFIVCFVKGFPSGKTKVFAFFLREYCANLTSNRYIFALLTRDKGNIFFLYGTLNIFTSRETYLTKQGKENAVLNVRLTINVL